MSMAIARIPLPDAGPTAISSRSNNVRNRPVGSSSDMGGMPPASRNHCIPVPPLTPSNSHAAAVDTPSATNRQNFLCTDLNYLGRPIPEHLEMSGCCNDALTPVLDTTTFVAGSGSGGTSSGGPRCTVRMTPWVWAFPCDAITIESTVGCRIVRPFIRGSSRRAAVRAGSIGSASSLPCAATVFGLCH
jgi:hypothetical protein